MIRRVSVVVPTYRRPALLSRCLAALLAQDYDPGAYEILIADDATSDDTRRLVEAWADDLGPPHHGPPIRYIPVTHTHGPAAARNAGWRAATGEIIAFTDDDCLPAPGWLKAGVGGFGKGVIGVWGRVQVPLPARPSDYEWDAARLEHTQFVTANCFCRREALAAIGGFDERFTAPWREDSDLFFNLLERYGQEGQRPALVCEPGAVVLHPIRSAPWGVSLSQQRKSMFNALLYKKHPTFYRQRIQASPPWRYYGIMAALLAGVGGALSGQAVLAIGGAGLWLWLTGQFCGQRLRQTSHAPRHVAEMLATSALIPPLAVFWRLRGACKFRVFFL